MKDDGDDKDFLALLSLWRLRGEEVMLMLDVNDGDIYKSKFVKQLAEPGIQMEGLFSKLTKLMLPTPTRKEVRLLKYHYAASLPPRD